MADGPVVGYATLPIIPSFQGIGSQLAGQISNPMKSAGKAGGLAFATGAVGAIAAAAPVAAIVGTFAGLYKVGSIFDDVSDNIRINTGKSGADLDALMASVGRVSTTVPAQLGQIGDTVSQVTQRLGYSGPVLEGFTSRVLELGRMTKAPVNIDNLSSALTGFRVPGDQANATLDRLFQISQATGVPVNDLTGALATQGTVLGRLGFSLEDSAALIGSLDRAGINASAVTRSLSAGIVRLAKDGEAPQDAFKRVTGEIQGYIDKGDEAAALDLAGKVFGTRGAAQFVGALQSGAISLDNLVGGLSLSGDTILGVSKETRDFSENLQLIKNKGLDLIRPAAEAVFNIFNLGFTKLTDFIVGLPPIGDLFGPLAAGAGPLLSVLAPVAQQLGAVLGPALTQLWATLQPVGAQLMSVLVPAFSGLWQAISPLIPQLLGLWTQLSPVMLLFKIIGPLLPTIIGLIGQLGSIVGSALAAVLPVVVDVVGQLAAILGDVLAAVLPVVVQLISQLAPVFSQVIAALLPLVTAVLGLIMPIINLLMPIITPLLDLLVQLIGIALQPLMKAFQFLLPPIIAIVTTLVGVLVPVIQAVTDILGGLIDFLVGVFTGDWKKAWGGIVKIFSGIFNGIVAIVKGVINVVIDVINGIIGGVNGIASTVKDATGGAIDIRIAKLPHLASGADVLARPGGTLAILGEAGQDETVTNRGVTNAALEATRELAEAALDGGLDSGTDVHVYLDGELLEPVAVRVVDKKDDQAGRKIRRRKRPSTRR